MCIVGYVMKCKIESHILIVINYSDFSKKNLTHRLEGQIFHLTDM
jgi:hypothetical protein